MLVVSIDGLAPRHITRAAMPALTTLALEGASCFTARTVTPPSTVPAHTSMLRGVDPATHGLSDNTPAPLRTGSPSFLRAARQAGRSTAIDAIHSTARLNDAAHRPAPGSGCL